MKFLNKITFILLLSIMVSCDRCKKEEDPNIIDTTKLPPATTTGENTMGCLINGEVWLPLKKNYLGNLSYNVSFEVTPLTQGGGVFIQSALELDNKTEMLFVLADDVIDNGIYYYPEWAILSNYFTNSCGVFKLDTTFVNYVEITNIDYVAKIVSGSFEMRVVNEECDTLTISEGRFDLAGN